MKPFPILCSVLLSINLLAQKPPIKFGDVPMDDLKMMIYERDSSASAVILADYGESVITYNQTKGFELRFERIKRIKILKKDGYDWANMTIPIYKKGNVNEKLIGLKAVTVNIEANKVIETKLGKDGIFTEKVSENWDYIKLTLPNVKEGSVIDITYNTTSPYMFNFQDWEFQTTIPIKWSEYIARIPEYFEYQRFAQGYVPFSVSDASSQRKIITLNSKERSTGSNPSPTSFSTQNIDYNENSFRWVAANVPAFREEPYMTTYRDYISKINFELALIRIPGQPIETVMGTWENINKELSNASEFGGVVKRSNFLNNTVDELIAGKVTASEKVEAVYSYVKNNLEWDGNYRKYTDGDFKRVIDEKKGNSAEINLMLVSLLQKAGIQADPVVLSTRNNGFVREQFPLSSQFNYVICAVTIDNKMSLLDATDRNLPISLLPERCLNGKGFLISETQPRWIKLDVGVKSRTVIDASVEFSENGNMKGTVKLIKDGYDAQRMRLDFNGNGEETYLKNLKERSGWTIHSSKFENLKDLNEAVSETYELSLAEGDGMADILYINPLLGNGVAENPFRSEKREYPVDFGSAFEKTHLIKLKIPDGYEVEGLPKPVALALPNNGGRFVYNISNMNGVITLTNQFIISKGLFSQVEYSGMKEFYAQVVAKNEEQIVLRKTKH